MNNKILWISFLVIAVLLVVAYSLNKDKQKNLVEEERQTLLEQELQKPSITLNTKYQFKDSKHTFVGSIELPTPCHTISSQIVKEGEQIILDIQTKTDAEMCAQVVTSKEFRITFDGNAEDQIIARLDGELVNLNITEVDPSKNIDDVKIFYKG